MKICYIGKEFRKGTLAIIEKAEEICLDYEKQGYDVTLRQLYYRFVALNLFPDDRTFKLVNGKWVRDKNGTKNADPNYDWLGEIINNARLAGYIDWKHVNDRTRNLNTWTAFDSPAECIEKAAQRYGIDLWQGQPKRVELWVEKEALAGIVGQVAAKWDCPYFSCRGYVSQSEMHAAGKRLAGYLAKEQHPVIIHLGDHDPSGIDMTRDIEERLRMFMTDGGYGYEGGTSDLEYDTENIELTIQRVALNMDQIKQYNPPPNPAKLSDSRCTGYIEKYGSSSWELDALTPQQLDQVISKAVVSHLDSKQWNKRLNQQKQEKETLRGIASKWDEIEEMFDGEDEDEEEDDEL